MRFAVVSYHRYFIFKKQKFSSFFDWEMYIFPTRDISLHLFMCVFDNSDCPCHTYLRKNEVMQRIRPDLLLAFEAGIIRAYKLKNGSC